MRALAAAAVAAALGITGIGLAAPAHAAALPACNDWSRVKLVGRDQGQSLPSRGYNTENYECRLEIGDSGPGVLVLQVNLRDCYNQQQVRPDAQYGPVTAQAVRNAQLWERTRQNDPSIEVDGVFGPVTSRAIFWEATNSAGAHLGCDRRYP